VTLRPDLVLVALPPRVERRRGRIVLLPSPREDADRMGLVLQVGDTVTSVQPRDRVLFDSYAVEEVQVDGWPCVLVPETALDAVVERE
jgi:co-chaperonin GroES (HSP10)